MVTSPARIGVLVIGLLVIGGRGDMVLGLEIRDRWKGEWRSWNTRGETRRWALRLVKLTCKGETYWYLISSRRYISIIPCHINGELRETEQKLIKTAWKQLSGPWLRPKTQWSTLLALRKKEIRPKEKRGDFPPLPFSHSTVRFDAIEDHFLQEKDGKKKNSATESRDVMPKTKWYESCMRLCLFKGATLCK